MSDQRHSLFSDDTPPPEPKKPKRTFKARSAAPPAPPAPKSRSLSLDSLVDGGTTEPVVKPTFKAREKPRDLSLEQAIRNLGPLLHPDEIAAHPEIFATPPSIRARITDWRNRHGLQA